MRRAIPTALLLLALSVGCSDPFAEAQQGDSIESYEAYLTANPNSRHKLSAELRLEELYLEKARNDKSLESYDVYMEKYPKGTLREKAVEERRDFMFQWCEETNTAEAWQSFLDQYPRGNKKLKQKARKRLRMAENRDNVGLGPVEMEQINLAENPDGPLDGWGFYVEVTNKGDKPIRHLVLAISYLDAEGGFLDTREWPAVASALPGNMPMEDGFSDPIKPGDTRTWEWETGDMPPGWTKKSVVRPVDIRFEGDDK